MSPPNRIIDYRSPLAAQPLPASPRSSRLTAIVWTMLVHGILALLGSLSFLVLASHPIFPHDQRPPLQIASLISMLLAAGEIGSAMAIHSRNPIGRISATVCLVVLGATALFSLVIIHRAAVSHQAITTTLQLLFAWPAFIVSTLCFGGLVSIREQFDPAPAIPLEPHPAPPPIPPPNRTQPQQPSES